MILYMSILISVYFVSAFRPNRFNILDRVFFLFLAAVSGFRYGVGTDYFNYVEYFNRGWEAPVEIGFLYLTALIGKLGLNSQAMFLVLSSLTMYFLYKGVEYYIIPGFTNKIVLYILLLLYFIFPSMNVVRQSLAASIILYASRYIVERNILRFYIWVIIAMLFHKTSAIFFLLYFFINKNFQIKILLFILIMAYSLASTGLFFIIFEHLITKFHFLDFSGKLIRYFYSNYNAREVSYGLVFLLNSTVTLIIIIFKKRIIRNEKSLVCFNLSYLNFLSLLFSINTPMLTRLTYFFYLFFAINTPQLLNIFGRNSRKVASFVFVSLYSAVFLYIMLRGYLNPESSQYFPYMVKFDLFGN